MKEKKWDQLRPVWAEIDLDAIVKNMQKIKELKDPEAELLAVVKGDGYGHGAVEVSQTMLENGVDRLGVAILEEAKELRKGSIEAPILTLSPMYEPQIPEFVEYNITPFITRVEMAEAIAEYGRSIEQVVDIHIKLDTGMGRLGFLPEEAVAKVKQIDQLDYVNIEGVCSHLPKAYADGKEAKEYTKQQIAKFKELVDKIEAAGIEIPIKHLANSAGILEYPESNFDMVRSGIINYGLWPCIKQKANRLAEELDIEFDPALQLKAEIAYTKELPADYGISYGGEFVTSEPTKIGVVPLGWGDGYPRFLTHKGEVIINGQRTDILGVICMDQLMVDLREMPEVEAGAEVLLVGTDELSAYEVADKIGSINYEIVTRVGPRVPRVYTKDEEVVKVKATTKQEVK